MQTNETISCSFIDLGLCLLTFYLADSIFSVEMEEWHASEYIILQSRDSLPSLLEVLWLLEALEVPVEGKQNAQNTAFDG